MIDVIDLFYACVYIQDHLEADLSLLFLAQTVGLSRFRFHRVFKAWRGETLHEFVTRMRMERAAFELSYPVPRSSRRSIKAIAFASGYKSLSSFSHAFSSYSQLSPREYRNRALRNRPAVAPAGYDGHLLGSFPISVGEEPAREIVIFDPVTRVGDHIQDTARAALSAARHIEGDRYGVELLPNLFARSHRNRGGMDRSSPLSCIGVGLDEWRRGTPVRHRNGEPAQPRATLRLEAGRYAVIHGSGPVTHLYRAWRRQFDAWLAVKGECPRPGRVYMRFEKPTDEAAAGSERWAMYIPLERPTEVRPRVAARTRASASFADAERIGSSTRQTVNVPGLPAALPS